MSQHPEPNARRTCVRCGSARIIPDAHVLDQTQASTIGGNCDLTVAVDGNPDALIFKKREYSHLRAVVCGSCGFTELYANDPRDLYDAFLARPGAGSERSKESQDWHEKGWDCPKCRSRVGQGLTICWNCGTSIEDREQPDFRSP